MSHVSTKGEVAIAILAKAPLPGLSKTRLIPCLGATGAAALQAWLLRRTVESALKAGIGPVTLWCAPDTVHPDFVGLAAEWRLSLRRQSEGHLGERMHQALAESTASGGTLVIGTDCPLLAPAHLQAAAAALAAHQAVVIPAEDGGYVLIGMQRAEVHLFTDIAWSSAHVMAQTRARLREIGWRWQEFDPLWDVDRPADFARLSEIFPEILASA